MEIKGRVARGDKEVTSRIAAHCVVPTTMDANVTRTGNTLHEELEGTDVAGRDYGVENGGGIGVSLVDGRGQVASKTTRVVGEGTGRVGGNGFTGEVEVDGPEVDRHVLEGARGDTSASATSWKLDGWKGVEQEGYIALVWDGFAVAGH